MQLFTFLFWATNSHKNIMYKKHVHLLPKSMYQNKVRTFQNYEKSIIYFRHTLRFRVRKMLNFLLLKEVLVASKACALTSRRYVSYPDISIPNLSDKLIILGALLRFCFGGVVSKIKFSEFFCLKRNFDG